MDPDAHNDGYLVPSYRAPDDAAWYHFLHGDVPAHQIDFMYRPEVPQGPLTPQHFSHLARLMTYIEPQTNSPFAFAIGNLSRDDIQHEPGHGGVALTFALRIRGVTDHAGRQDPPFAHAIAAIDRELEPRILFAAAMAFHAHVLGAAESAEWYRSYVRCATEEPAQVLRVLSDYAATFDDLPCPRASSLGARWTAEGATLPRRVVIVHEDDAPFELVARCATRIAAMLYQSDIRWTSISNGREADLPNGVSIRIVAERDLLPADMHEGVRRLNEIPEDEAEIAHQLFGALPSEIAHKPTLGWRERYGYGAPADTARASSEGQPFRGSPVPEHPRPSRPSYAASAKAPPDEESTQVWARRPESSTEAAATDTDALTAGPLPVSPAPIHKPEADLTKQASPARETLPPRADIHSSPPLPTTSSWEPTPDLRASRAPLVRWSLISATVAGVALLVFHLVSTDAPRPAPALVPDSETTATPATTEAAAPSALPSPPPQLTTRVAGGPARAAQRGKRPPPVAKVPPSVPPSPSATTPPTEGTSVINGPPIFH